MQSVPVNRAFLLLRYTLIVTTAYLLLVEEQFVMPPAGTILLIAMALASNVVVAQLPVRLTESSSFGVGTVIVDTLWITGVLLHSGRFNAEFFYLYFFILLLAAIGENLRSIAIGAVAVCIAYIYLLAASGGSWSLWASPSLIRIPFLFTAAAFYGYLVERTRTERRRADVVEGERQRAEVALQAKTEQLRDEAEGSATLARLGHELISLLDTPTILDRLCQLTAEELGSDSSRTFLLQAEEGVYLLAAAHGATPEERREIRTLKVRHGDIQNLLVRLDRDDVVAITAAARGDRDCERMPQGGDALQVVMALRRGAQIIGLHTASWRTHAALLSAKRCRVAGGIAQLGSLALANARLVEELEHANGLKADLVASVSHELRSPLNLIIGYNDLLLDGAFGALTSEQAQTLRTVAKSSRDLLDLIEATLDLSRIGSRRFPLDLREVSISHLVGELDAETVAWRTKPEVQFSWNLPPVQSRLYTDPVKLKMVLKNLITNAFKFTERGSVTVGVHAHDGGVEMCVSDTGIGIAPADREIIFEPFRQAPRAVDDCAGGVGLGLHIVRRLVDLLGGTITLESEVGQGSTFRVWVPSQPAQAGAGWTGAPPPSARLAAPVLVS